MKSANFERDLRSTILTSDILNKSSRTRRAIMNSWSWHDESLMTRLLRPCEFRGPVPSFRLRLCGGVQNSGQRLWVQNSGKRFPGKSRPQQCRSWKRHFYRIVGWCSIFGVFSSRLTRSCCCPTLSLPPRSYVLSRICFAISRCCPTLPFLSRSFVLTRVWFAMSFFARSSLRLSHCFGWLQFFRSPKSMQPGNSFLKGWMVSVHPTWTSGGIQTLGWRNPSTSRGCILSRRVSNNLTNVSSQSEFKYSNVKITLTDFSCSRIEEIGTFTGMQQDLLN